MRLFLFSIALSFHAFSHSDHPGEGTIKWRVLVALCALSALYVFSWVKAKKRSFSSPNAPYLRISLFFGAVICLLAALMPPIDTLSESLASVHMVQHTLIMMVAAPLMALAAPDYFWVFSLPKTRSARVKLGYRYAMLLSKFRRPLAIWTLYAITLYVWHLPKMYEAALKNQYVHDLQHLAFFGSSFLFWRVVLYPFGRQLSSGIAVLYLFVSMLHAMALGVLMALSPAPWYRPYFESAQRFGISALTDQQIAGFIMWMPAGISFLIVALISMARILSAGQRKPN